ncbi:MAG: hypothetical protein AAF639_19060 [Chloroflexota bacterium]
MSRLNEHQQPRPFFGWDVLLLGILVFAHLQITGFAESTLPHRLQDVLRHPILGNILPAAGEEAMGSIGPRPGEPLGLVLNAILLGLLLLYALVDVWGNPVSLNFNRRVHISTKAKWLLLWAILIAALFLPTTKLILLRQGSGPASYTHDGGVIQTESTIQFFLEGKNPYSEDYTETPMAEWGFSEYRTALYHYPYFPWTYIFSTPFYLIGQALGLYDQRMVYLLLMAIALALAPTLVPPNPCQPHQPRKRLALVALLGLNPLMALDVWFGQNDSFVLCWVLFSLVAWQKSQNLRPTQIAASKRWLLFSVIMFGFACVSKLTAWFFAPFYGYLLITSMQSQSNNSDESGSDKSGSDENSPTLWETWQGILVDIPAVLVKAWPALVVLVLILGPYVIWDGYALYDDVVRWSSGQGETGYQIWGWGASNFVLASGQVTGRFDQWPFWQIELIITVPVLLWFVYRQKRMNTLSAACWHYGLLLFAFFYGSRFLNENYLGYILAFLAVGYFSEE